MKAEKGLYYTVTEAARVLGVNVSRIRQLIYAKRILGTKKAGNIWLIKAPIRIERAEKWGGCSTIPSKAYVRNRNAS
jgi:excisionase family DNA binding protein